ncbi:MAG: Sua5/YciO/YrdC/YwlC family protein, partial [Acidobacteriota bacterium]
GLLRQLLAVTGPLTGTSANRHGDRPAVDVAGAIRSLVGDPDMALDGGPAPGGQASTLVDLSGTRARVLRQGAETWEIRDLRSAP